MGSSWMGVTARSQEKGLVQSEEALYELREMGIDFPRRTAECRLRGTRDASAAEKALKVSVCTVIEGCVIWPKLPRTNPSNQSREPCCHQAIPSS